MALPQKNVAYVYYVSLGDTANPGKFKTNPTLAAGDFQVSIDGGAFVNLTTLPAVEPAGSSSVRIDLSATEMDGDKVQVMARDVLGNQWEDLLTFLDVPPSSDTDVLIARQYAANFARLTDIPGGRQVQIYADGDTDGTGPVLFEFTIIKRGHVEERTSGL